MSPAYGSVPDVEAAAPPAEVAPQTRKRPSRFVVAVIAALAFTGAAVSVARPRAGAALTLAAAPTGVNSHTGKISPDDDTKNAEKKQTGGAHTDGVSSVRTAGVAAGQATDLTSFSNDDTTKTNNEWHEHKHSSSCVSDSDCESEYTCEQGQCMTYQPDVLAVEDCKQSQANGHGCGKAGGVGATASKDGPITPGEDTKNSDKKENGGSTQYDIDDVSDSGLHSGPESSPDVLAAQADDDTTKTNEEWHEHKHSSKCVSDSDCSSEYTCEQGQCVVYQPDVLAVEDCKQSQANGHGCGKAGGVGATASKDGPITPGEDTKNSDKKENGGSTQYDIDDVSDSGLHSGPESSPDVLELAVEDCKQSQANGHGCGKAGGVSATASKDGPITPGEDTKNSDKKENGGATQYDIDDVSDSGLHSGPESSPDVLELAVEDCKQSQANGHGCGKAGGVGATASKDGPITPGEDTKNSDKKENGGSTQYDIDDVSDSGLHSGPESSPDVLAAQADDDTTKTNEEWHEHKHSSKCVSDSDCSSEYTCEQGQCVVYQPDRA